MPRTLAVCGPLAGDHDDMVAKGLSWALRELIVHDRGAVERFLTEHETRLPALVKREVRNKLMTGRKAPPRRAGRRPGASTIRSRRGDYGEPRSGPAAKGLKKRGSANKK